MTPMALHVSASGLTSLRLPPSSSSSSSSSLSSFRCFPSLVRSSRGTCSTLEVASGPASLNASSCCAARRLPRRASRSSDGSVALASSAGQAAEADEGVVERARMEARRREQVELEELQKPLAEYMSLPVSQYSVLDAERIERVDENTFKCYAHRLSFMSFEVCPVLLVRVDEKPQGCCIRLLSCTLDGSPIVTQSNERFSASMENNVSWSVKPGSPPNSRLLVSDTSIQVTVEVPGPFKIIPKEVIESAGSQVLSQLLRVAMPRFLTQLRKDYEAWASGDTSRKPLGTGEI